MTTITIDRSVVEQALKSMDKATRFMSDSDYKKLNQAIEDLKAALAAPVQEPVAPAMRDAAVYGVGISRDGKRIDPASIYAQPAQEPYCHVYEYDSPLGIHRTLYPKKHNGKQPDRAIPLYAAPPQQPEPVQEAVKFWPLAPLTGYYDVGGKRVWLEKDEPFPAPPQRKPLTEKEIEKAYREIWRDLPTDFYHTSSGWIEQGIRYAERAHGIGETK